MALNYSQIAARFPEFASNDVSRQSVIESIAIAASKEIDAVTWGDLAEEGLYWLTASKLAIGAVNQFAIGSMNSGNAFGDPSFANAKKISIDKEIDIEYNDPSSVVGKLLIANGNQKNNYLIEYERLLSLVSDGIFYSFE